MSPTDPTGCNFSIIKLMNLQFDFINELTLLQFHGNKLGVIVDRSPKCHPEIAGEGIEYLWGLSKVWYRKAPIARKRSKESFRTLVSEATDGNTVLNIQRVRSCSKKARAYMKLYKAFRELTVEEFSLIANKYSLMESAIKKYSKLKKKGKTHRNVLDRNNDDILEIEQSIPAHPSLFSSQSVIPPHSTPITLQSDTNSNDSNKIKYIKEEVIGKLLNKMNSM